MNAPRRAPLRLALLGCGFAAQLAAGALRGLKSQVRLLFASRDEQKASTFDRRYGGAGAFASYEQALASDKVDAVFVATPPVSHLEWTLRALRQGKDVIVEKPAFMRSTDFDEVEVVQQETGRMVLVAENYFYKPLARTLRRVLAERVVGDVQFLLVNALKGQAASGWRADASVSGGGALFEGGVHWINFLANLGLEVESVQGFAPAGGGELERSIMAVFAYAGGPVGTLHYSWQTPSPLKGLRLSRIYGRAGSVVFETNGLFVGLWGSRKRILFPGLRDLTGRVAMFRDFLLALRERKQPQMSLALARRDLELVETIYRTAADRGDQQ